MHGIKSELKEINTRPSTRWVKNHSDNHHLPASRPAYQPANEAHLSHRNSCTTHCAENWARTHDVFTHYYGKQNEIKIFVFALFLALTSIFELLGAIAGALVRNFRLKSSSSSPKSSTMAIVIFVYIYITSVFTIQFVQDVISALCDVR